MKSVALSGTRTRIPGFLGQVPYHGLMVGHLARKARDAGLSPTQRYTFRLKNSLAENYKFLILFKSKHKKKLILQIS